MCMQYANIGDNIGDYTVVTHSQRYYSAICVHYVINSVSTVKKYFFKVKMIFISPKSQSEIEIKPPWNDFTLTFWRNEKVNHLAKIISWVYAR